MRNIFFYIPFVYSCHTRLNNKSAILEFLSFDFAIAILIGGAYPDFDIFKLLIGFLFTYSLYEFGYIQNDAETIKKEKAPTLRLSSNDLDFYESHKCSIYLARVIWGLTLGIFFYYSSCDCIIILWSALIIPIFLLYNYIRNKWNLYVHVILMLLRFSSPILLVINKVDIILLIWILAFYPIERFILLSIRGKFGYKNKLFQRLFFENYVRHSIHIFGLSYYAIFNIVAFTLILLGVLPINYIIPSVYWLSLMIFAYRKDLINYKS